MPLIAAAAARYYEQEEWLNSPFRKYTPWALADAARVCLAYGTEYNRAEASEQDLLQILNAYSRFEDPVVRDHDGRACLLRMAGQQMTWQASEPQALARTAAIFTQTSLLRHESAPGQSQKSATYRRSIHADVAAGMVSMAPSRRLRTDWRNTNCRMDKG